MAVPSLVLLETDDAMHANTGEPTFNESAYYNFYDVRRRLGGFVRIGNRPNEGYAEMTVCLYLPDGAAAFMYWRPEISGNERFDAAGLSFDVVTPFKEHRIAYDGMCCMLARPLELVDPRAAFTSNPHVPVSIDLRYLGLSPVFGGEPQGAAEPPDAEFARGHLEQHGRALGTVVVDGAEYAIDGCGLRDRSWGPRTWQALLRYRWLTMAFGPDAGIAATLIVRRDGTEIHGGYIYRGGEPNLLIDRVEIETTVGSEDGLHSEVSAVLAPADGGRAQRVAGRVLNMVPLRNRRGGVTTRIAEGLTEWQWDDRVGYGWSEYLDH